MKFSHGHLINWFKLSSTVERHVKTIWSPTTVLEIWQIAANSPTHQRNILAREPIRGYISYIIVRAREPNNNLVNNQSGIRNLFLMYTNIQNCFNIIEEKYDIYIRARYDLIFQNPIYIENYIFKILKNEKDIIIPKAHKFEEDNDVN